MLELVEVASNSTSQAYSFYLWLMSVSDRRSKGWFLVDSPTPIAVCCISYLGMVWIGPKLMKNRRPFDLKWIMIFYNLTVALINAYIVYKLLISSTRLGYSYICQPYRESYHPDDLQIAKAIWWHFFTKLLDYFDTLFFILRKKTNQMTFLHVYHHSTTSIVWWMAVKWVPSDSTFVGALINSVVHVPMYFYYGLAACGPKLRKYLWWKKYLTMLQLLQFAISFIWATNSIRLNCAYPHFFYYTFGTYMVTNALLFINFYRKQYTTDKAKNTKTYLETNGKVKNSDLIKLNENKKIS